MSFWKILGGLYILDKISNNNRKISALERKIENYEREVEFNDSVMEISSKIKNVDFEELYDELEENNIDREFLDEIISYYVKNVKIEMTDIDVYDDVSFLKVIVKKPDLDIFKSEIIEEWEKLNKKEFNDITDDEFKKMRNSLLKIVKENSWLKKEDELSLTANKKYYEWELDEYSRYELIHSVSDIDIFTSIIIYATVY